MNKFLIAALVIFTACTSAPPPPAPSSPTPTPAPTPAPIGWAIVGTIAAAGATLIATNGACTNPAAIQASIAKIAPAAFCPTVAAAKATLTAVRTQKDAKFSEKGVIGNIACPLLVGQIGTIAMGKVDPTWGCSGGTTLTAVEGWLTTVCEQNV